MGRIAAELAELEPAAQARVVAYMVSRYGPPAAAIAAREPVSEDWKPRVSQPPGEVIAG